jgi:hypothetical protein
VGGRVNKIHADCAPKYISNGYFRAQRCQQQEHPQQQQTTSVKAAGANFLAPVNRFERGRSRKNHCSYSHSICLFAAFSCRSFSLLFVPFHHNRVRLRKRIIARTGPLRSDLHVRLKRRVLRWSKRKDDAAAAGRALGSIAAIVGDTHEAAGWIEKQIT